MKRHVLQKISQFHIWHLLLCLTFVNCSICKELSIVVEIVEKCGMEVDFAWFRRKLANALKKEQTWPFFCLQAAILSFVLFHPIYGRADSSRGLKMHPLGFFSPAMLLISICDAATVSTLFDPTKWKGFHWHCTGGDFHWYCANSSLKLPLSTMPSDLHWLWFALTLHWQTNLSLIAPCPTSSSSALGKWVVSGKSAVLSLFFSQKMCLS